MSQGGSSGDDGQSLQPAGGKAGIFEFCTILYHSVPFCTILYHSVPFCTILYHSVPFCTILYHFVPFWGVGSRRGRVGGFGAGAAGGKAGIFEFCTILYHFVPFWGIGSRRGRVGGFGAGAAGGKAGFFEFCTILYHSVPFCGVGSRRGRVGGFGAGAAFGHDTSRASVAGLDWVRRYGRDLTCIHDKGSLGGWARGKCQWWGRDYDPL